MIKKCPLYYEILDSHIISWFTLAGSNITSLKIFNFHLKSHVWRSYKIWHNIKAELWDRDWNFSVLLIVSWWHLYSLWRTHWLHYLLRFSFSYSFHRLVDFACNQWGLRIDSSLLSWLGHTSIDIIRALMTLWKVNAQDIHFLGYPLIKNSRYY